MSKVQHQTEALPDRARMAREIELKLEFAPRDVRRILRHSILAAAKALPHRGGHLHAVYYDTPDHALEKAGLSLRVRQERGRSVQTIKAEHKSHSLALDRAEWECLVESDAFDPAAAAGTPLARFLSDPATRDRITPLFTVDTDRHAFLIERDSSQIEVAIDTAKATAADRAERFGEVELELKGGEPGTLFALARELAETIPLRLSLMTKSERAYALLEKSALKPARAERIHLPQHQTSAEAFQIVARSCLAQAIRNDAVLRKTGDPEVLHQLRVGLRRLRAVTSIFKGLLRDKGSRACCAELRWMAKRLNRARDMDVLLDNLHRSHAPRSDVRTIEAHRQKAYDALFRTLAKGRFESSFLELASWIETGAWLTRDKRKARAARLERVEERIARDLSRRWKRIRKGITRLDALDFDERHKLRIRIKTLRYGSEFAIDLFDAPEIRRKRKAFLAQLEAMQDALGEMNDQAVAGILAPKLKSAPKETKQRQHKLLGKATAAGGELLKSGPFWLPMPRGADLSRLKKAV
ncbi:CYTH and CHAD domain-containing protein [Microvirga flavescens]|uniref:CYTH and CHAD domain-containing protein n=1 Tax=Microvirga flavescens TaxID=2249811 RepID=UPI000DDAB21D|nr:CYTH and CHAD domain-containing protein [Microvirga flavescens]